MPEAPPARLAHIFTERHAATIAAHGEILLEASRERSLANFKRRFKDDPMFRAMVNCRRRFKAAMRQAKTPKPAIREFGYTPSQFRLHIERLFLPGMTWDNYGTWEVDHKRPCRTFDLRDEGARRACFALSNLQPLWKRKNRQKSGSYKGLKPGLRLTIDGRARL